MKITVNLTKAELDLVEEALLQYQKLLLESANPDEMISYELRLCRRIFEEFGMEELETVVGVQQPNYASGREAQPQQVQAYAAPQGSYTQQRQVAAPPQQSASYSQPPPNQYPFSR